ncbi:unnamed protein product [Trichogramma brassicae]|uniref:Uncharacterized protein n=1 Tax=Trichogramma brassicae TaxID=86971 RepID=A0A6H5I0B2_9HYME|nr:unnamed protein product [Trichogramma brassicae]
MLPLPLSMRTCTAMHCTRRGNLTPASYLPIFRVQQLQRQKQQKPLLLGSAQSSSRGTYIRTVQHRPKTSRERNYTHIIYTCIVYIQHIRARRILFFFFARTCICTANFAITWRKYRLWCNIISYNTRIISYRLPRRAESKAESSSQSEQGPRFGLAVWRAKRAARVLAMQRSVNENLVNFHDEDEVMIIDDNESLVDFYDEDEVMINVDNAFFEIIQDEIEVGMITSDDEFLQNSHDEDEEILVNEIVDEIMVKAAPVRRRIFIEFLVKTGYKDVPYVDEDGKILCNRTTAIHHAAKMSLDTFSILFTIYDKFDVNFTDESGLSHFHLACKYGYEDVVCEFLEHGQNPNCVWTETGDSALHLALSSQNWQCDRIAQMLLEQGAEPSLVNKDGVTLLHLLCKREMNEDLLKLFCWIYSSMNIDAQDSNGNTPLHEALRHGQRKWACYLLESGADPNLVNTMGLTPLQVICQRTEDDEMIKFFFKTVDGIRKTVVVNDVDKLGRTALEYAVASLLPRAIDELLSRGANLRGFHFPTEDYFDKVLNQGNLHSYHFKLRIALGALSVVEKLEKGGYELDRSDAITIMNIFAKCKLFEKTTNFDARWYDDEKFTSKAKEIKIRPDLSLYELTWLRAKEATTKLTPTDYYEEFVFSRKLNNVFRKHKEACAIHLCVKLSRVFFHEWAQDPFSELIHGRLPLECCNMIIENLDNEDLHRILLAATPQSSK